MILSFFAEFPPLIEKLKPVSSRSASYVHVSLTEWFAGVASTWIGFVTAGCGQTSVNIVRTHFVNFISVLVPHKLTTQTSRAHSNYIYVHPNYIRLQY